ncbi:hypothetical protein ACGV4K_08450 [Streptomyces sp. WAC8370]|uniref:hypothetical protein n=1 Tax=Streptomyces sp. WAC8370 TaxID=3351348 RepID=UPI003F78DC18
MRESPGEALGGRHELQHDGQLPGHPRHPGYSPGPLGHPGCHIRLAQSAGRGRRPQVPSRILQPVRPRQCPPQQGRPGNVAVQSQADPSDRVPQESFRVRRRPSAELDDGRRVADVRGRLHGIGQYVKAVASRQDPHGLGRVSRVQLEPAPELGDLHRECDVPAGPFACLGQQRFGLSLPADEPGRRGGVLQPDGTSTRLGGQLGSPDQGRGSGAVPAAVASPLGGLLQRDGDRLGLAQGGSDQVPGPTVAPRQLRQEGVHLSDLGGGGRLVNRGWHERVTKAHAGA